MNNLWRRVGTALGFYKGAAAGRANSYGNAAHMADRPHQTYRYEGLDLTRRCLWLYSNNSLFRNAIDKFVANILPSPIGIRPPESFDGRAWQAWAEERRQFSLNGTFDFYEAQNILMRTAALEGEAFIVFHNVAGNLRIEILGGLSLDDGGPGALRAGIEIGRDGRPTAYHFKNRETNETVRYPASAVRHVFRPIRPGAMFGEPIGVAFQADLGTMGEWLGAELRSQALAARWTGVAISQFGEAFGPGGLQDPTVVDIDDMQLMRLAPGEDVKFPVRNAPATSFGEFWARQLQGGAGSMGLTYAQISGDYSKTSYSSARMAHLDRLPLTKAWRCWFRDFAVAEIYEEFVRFSSIVSGRAIPDGALRPIYRMPGDRMLDPQREAAAIESALRMGRTSLSAVIASEGDDPAEVFDAIESDVSEFIRRGIPVTWFNSVVTGSVETVEDDGAKKSKGDDEDDAT